MIIINPLKLDISHNINNLIYEVSSINSVLKIINKNIKLIKND